MPIFRLCSILLLCMAACASEPHILRTGNLAQPVVLRTDVFDVAVVHVKSGAMWTNVWMDVRVCSKSTEEQLFDPRDLELFVPSVGISFKHSQRQVVAHTPGTLTFGDRDTWEGQRDWTPPVKVSPGTIIQATLMFETNRGQAEDLRSFELVYRGQRVNFADPRPATQQQQAQPETATPPSDPPPV